MTSFIAMALLGGLVLGWLTGRRYQKASRAWTDYRTTKASVPGFRAVAWALTRPTVLFVLVAFAVAAYALYMAAGGTPQSGR
ncbi:MAG: hypothetical protein ACRDT6_02630 [Micromonosporaceae bacterium]